jgi:hypothetical protein
MVYPLHMFHCDPLDFKCRRQGLSDIKLCVQDALLIVQTSLSLTHSLSPSLSVEINSRILSPRACTFRFTDRQ